MAPDGVFIFKLKAETTDQTDAIVVLWKWLLVSVICGSASVGELCRRRAEQRAEALRKGELVSQLRFRMGRAGWIHFAVGTAGVCAASLHTLGLIHATPSIAIMLFYLYVLWSVLIDACILGAPIRLHTALALVFALMAAALPAGAALLDIGGQTDHGAVGCEVEDGGEDNCAGSNTHAEPHSMPETLLGFGASLLAGAGYSSFLTTCRSASTACPHVPMNLAAMAGNILVGAKCAALLTAVLARKQILHLSF